MDEIVLDGVRRCSAQVTLDGWHFRRCDKPAKWLVSLSSGEVARCGIHARGWRKGQPDLVRPLSASEQQP
jgi:hypothetical protein